MKISEVTQIHSALDTNANNNLSSYIDLYGFITDNIILTYNGTLIVGFEIAGMDPEGLSHEDLHRETKRFATLLQEVDRHAIVYQWLLRRRIQVEIQESSNELYNSFLVERRDTLKGNTFFENKMFIALEYPYLKTDSAAQTMKEKVPEVIMDLFETVKGRRVLSYLKEKKNQIRQSKENRLQVSVKDLQKHIEEKIIPSIQSVTESLKHLKPRILAHQEFYESMLPLCNIHPDKQRIRLVNPAPLNSLLDNSSYDLSSGRFMRLDGYFVDILTLKQINQDCFHRMLEQFESLDFECIVSSQWGRISDDLAEKVITRQRRGFNNSLKFAKPNGNNPSEEIQKGYKKEVVNYLDHALTELKNDGNWFGKFSLTVMFWGETEEQLNQRKAHLRNVFYEMEAVPFDEDIGLFFAWVSMLPGGYWKYNYRKLLLTNLNMAAFSLIWNLDSGNPRSEVYQGECLSILQTRSGNPYYFNLSHSDNINFMALGKIGSGKSFFVKYHLLQYFKYGQGFYWIHTLGSDYNDLARMTGGQVVELDANGSFPIHLYCLEEDLSPGYLNALVSVWKSLFLCLDHEMTEDEQNELIKKIQILFKQPVSKRNNRALFELVESSLKPHIHEFINDEGHTGRFGRLFDGSPHDPRAFTQLSHFTVIDYKGLVKENQALANASMIFISYMQDKIIYNKTHQATPKFCWLDEGDKIVGRADSYMGQYIKKAGDTWRKEKCSLGFITQRLDHLKRLELLELFRECCSQFLFFPNPGISEEEYLKAFDFLSTRDVELIKTIQEKKEVLFITTHGVSKVLTLKVDRFTAMVIDSNPNMVARKEALFERYGFPENIHQLIKEQNSIQETPTERQPFGILG